VDESGGVKITFVIPYFYPAWQYGGQPRSAFELARSLVARGHSVRVLTTDSGGANRLEHSGRNEMRDIEGIEVLYYSNLSNSLAYRHRLFWPPEFFRRVHEQLLHTDILHIHELRSPISASAYRAAVSANVPYVISPHGGLRHLGKKIVKAAFDALWGKRILGRAGALIAVSPVEENDARAFGVETHRIRRLPNAINVGEYQHLPPRDAFRSRRQIRSSKIVLFLGRLHRIKGPDLLLEAFRKVLDTFADIHLVIAGPDDGEESRLRRFVHAMRMEAAVTFTGFLDEAEKREALGGSDVTVLPSRSEVFALSAIESLLCGTPVIMSSVCGMDPLPEPERGLVTFVTENVNDLASKVLMMAGPAPFRHNVAAGREFVCHEFSAGTIAAKAESIYEEVLRRHG